MRAAKSSDMRRLKQLPLAVQIRSEHRFDRIWRGKLESVAWLAGQLGAFVARHRPGRRSASNIANRRAPLAAFQLPARQFTSAWRAIEAGL
jgi:hypothetical protein